MNIKYEFEIVPSAEQVIDLYDSAGLPRPIKNQQRIQKMFNNSNLIVTAWDKEILVGVSRSITDWVWCCYLADLAVRKEYQGQGIGKRLVQLTKERLCEQSMILLLSLPSVMNYYPKLGFVKQESSFIVNREEWE